MDSITQDDIVTNFLTLLSKSRKRYPKTIPGFTVNVESDSIQFTMTWPTLPVRPQPSDCCGSGCTPCIYDAYKQDLQEYETIYQEIEMELICRIKQLERLGCVVQSRQDHIMTLSRPNSLKIEYLLLQDYKKPSLNMSIDGTQEPALDPKEYRSFQIHSITFLNQNSLFIKGIISKDSRGIDRKWEIEPGQHIQIGYIDNSNTRISRSFTPTTHPHIFGSFELHIRLYQNSVMSQYLTCLNPGNFISVRGPIDDGFRFASGKVNLIIYLKIFILVV